MLFLVFHTGFEGRNQYNKCIIHLRGLYGGFFLQCELSKHPHELPKREFFCLNEETENKSFILKQKNHEINYVKTVKDSFHILSTGYLKGK